MLDAHNTLNNRVNYNVCHDPSTVLFINQILRLYFINSYKLCLTTNEINSSKYRTFVLFTLMCMNVMLGRGTPVNQETHPPMFPYETEVHYGRLPG